MEWELKLKYKGVWYKQKAAVEYSSRQILRIRVLGKHGSLLLRNDYPAIRFTNSKKGVKWKMEEGTLNAADADGAQLLVDIFSQLEFLIKRDFEKIYPPGLF